MGTNTPIRYWRTPESPNVVLVHWYWQYAERSAAPLLYIQCEHLIY